jgi:hypothetical protein
LFEGKEKPFSPPPESLPLQGKSGIPKKRETHTPSDTSKPRPEGKKETGMKRILAVIVALWMMLSFNGCSMDVGQVLEHPKQVKPSDQFEATVLNQYVWMDTASKALQTVTRDSIHLAVGMPDGYSVVAAKYYYASNLNILKLATKIDSAAAEQMLKDSSAAYKSRATAMQSSPQFVNILKGRSYKAENATNGDSISVNTDAVKNWSAWSGKISISIPAGTPVDTMIADPSTGMDFGVISKPVFLWLTLKAKSSAGLDTLYYFTTTGILPDPSDAANTDRGQITFTTLSVSNSAVRLSSHSKKDSPVMSIYSCPGNDNVIVQFNANYKDATALQVFNASGMKVADLSSALSGSKGSFTWNTKNYTIKPGMYILRLKSRKGIFSAPLRVL